MQNKLFRRFVQLRRAAPAQPWQPLRLPTHHTGWTGTFVIALQTAPTAPCLTDPPLQRLLLESWHALSRLFPSLIFDEFGIAPNQVLLIVSLSTNIERTLTLGYVLETFRSLAAVAWLAHLEASRQECPGRFWRRSYSAHVIHNALELEQARFYIRRLSSPPARNT